MNARITGTTFEIDQWTRRGDAVSGSVIVGRAVFNVVVPLAWVEFYEPARDEPLTSIELDSAGYVWQPDKTSSVGSARWYSTDPFSTTEPLTWDDLQSTRGPTTRLDGPVATSSSTRTRVT